ncbi:hypothetical protein [Candidatus Magnetominusculus dajiuhuensis]|uniref:hypothetical protein n=1 Tax=Candidatus Magnetominusculus dajiuhuensis TaxID=3137712 RepID=UPI003B435B49
MERKNHFFSLIEPNENLKSSIINRIKKEEIKRAIYRVVLDSAISLISVSIAIIYIVNIIKDAYQSGLFDYISLLFSDGASIISFWQSYVMSVVETLPIIPIAIVVASILVFVWSVSSVLKAFEISKPRFYKIN